MFLRVETFVDGFIWAGIFWVALLRVVFDFVSVVWKGDIFFSFGPFHVVGICGVA